MIDFEGLGVFFLGHSLDPKGASAKREPFLYDSKDLTTHGLIVGMTGSGKTGLGVVLLEEAALDGIPALVIDPKGDMANMALRFPMLRPSDFAPWIDPAEATRRGLAPESLAVQTAEEWAQGLAESGQGKKRLRALERAGDVEIYTPGSSSGRPIALLGSFDAPGDDVLGDADALRERVLNTTSGLLGLIGIDADPVTSREHVLIANILEATWRSSGGTTLTELLRSIQQPPFEQLGALDLESFFPARERFALATRLNHLLASPAFAAWRDGAPLDIGSMLYGPDGRPRHTVLSIAHLGDRERMFFVTLFLNEVIAWMRGQDGTGSLRAMVYMDEIAGYFPPVASPPSKAPMLTLLKQARAFGLGVVLATQNPVDLDYKGLGNIGTWFLGRLQTARDRDRLLDGLTSAASGGDGAGTGLDRSRAEEVLGSLGKREFLSRNVHENEPALFQTRWAMSYLRGPLSLPQVQSLAGSAREPESSTHPSAGTIDVPVARPKVPVPVPALERKASGSVIARPVLPSGVDECFLSGGGAVYRPALLASVEVHYVHSRHNVDHWERVDWLVALDKDTRQPEWDTGELVKIDEASILNDPVEGLDFSPLPQAAAEPKRYGSWQKSFLSFLYRERPLELRRCKELQVISRPGELPEVFQARVTHLVREKRDAELEKLRNRYEKTLLGIDKRIRAAEQRLEREQSQYSSSTISAAIGLGATLAGALFGRKLASVTNVQHAGSAARSATRAKRERDDVARARESLRAEKARLAEIEEELKERTSVIQEELRADSLEIDNVTIRMRKADTSVERFALAWVPTD